jgi:hypothetical protein
MSDQLTNSIALSLIIGSLVLVLLATVPYVIGLPRSVRRRRRVRQLEQLEKVRAAHQGQDLEIDWIDYKEIPKAEIINVLGKHSWQYVDEHISAKSRLLRFSLEPATRRSPDARARLTEELATANPNVEGRYLLDTTQYLDVGSGT